MYYSYLWIDLIGFEMPTSWQTKRLAIHFARLCLLGHSLISCPSQKFLLWLHSLQTFFPALSLSCVSRAVLVRNAYEKRAEFRGFTSSEPGSSLLIQERSTGHPIFPHYSCCFSFPPLWYDRKKYFNPCSKMQCWFVYKTKRNLWPKSAVYGTIDTAPHFQQIDLQTTQPYSPEGDKDEIQPLRRSLPVSNQFL